MKKIAAWWVSECNVARYLNEEGQNTRITKGEVVTSFVGVILLIAIVGIMQTCEASIAY